MTEVPSLPYDPTTTSIHIGKAVSGEAASTGWLINHFSPLLLLQARYRLTPSLARSHDPEDIVQDVWASVIPKLSTLRARDGRLTPVLLKYLATTLLRRVNTLLRDEVRGKPERDERSRVRPGSPQELPASVTGAFTHAAESEARRRIMACLDHLSANAREVLVLRGIEQLSNDAVATRLGEAKSTISMRFSRALEDLRTCLPGSIFDELG